MTTTKATKTETVKRAQDVTGADLARLGFRQDKGHRAKASWYVKGNVRVCLVDEEAGELAVYVFDGPVDRGSLDWETKFSAYAPAEVVTSMLLKTVGG